MKSILLFPQFTFNVTFSTSGVLYITLIFIYLCSINFSALAQNKIWDKSYGGKITTVIQEFEDEGRILRDTSYYGTSTFSVMVAAPDGGYLLGGYSNSDAGVDKSQDARDSKYLHKSYDYWVIKIDVNGQKQWDRRFGGMETDWLTAIVTTHDGGYLLGGWTSSGKDGDKSEPSVGASNDYWVVKIDGNGNKVWDKTYGGFDDDRLETLISTTDGGYLLGGYSFSNIGGDKSESSRGSNRDFWVLKIDRNGKKIWDKTFGGNSYEQLTTMVETSSNSYILGGRSGSGISGDRSKVHRGGADYWVLKIDKNGKKLWDKVFGGSQNDFLESIIATPDNNYILAGSSSSGQEYDKSQASKGREDYWLVKINSKGEKIWDKTYGGSELDDCRKIVAAYDGGFILGGSTLSNKSGDVSEPASIDNLDYWILKIDSKGLKVWDRRFGGNGFDNFQDLVASPDGSYLLGGYSNSDVSGKRTAIRKGYNYDFWVVKVKDKKVNPPIVTSFSPQRGLPGDKVYLRGSNLGTTQTVLFNGIEASFTVTSDTKVVAVIPKDATSGKITIKTASGKDTFDKSFKVLQPSICKVSPKKGEPGTKVCIIGRYLSTTKEVSFNGTKAKKFKVHNDRLVSAIVPNGAKTGKITIRLEGGAKAKSSREFVVIKLTASSSKKKLADTTSLFTLETLEQEKLIIYPNPFYDGLTIAATLEHEMPVQLIIYSELGQLVRTIPYGILHSGQHNLSWDGRNSQGVPVAKGLYFYHVIIGDKRLNGKIIKSVETTK